MPTLSIQCCKLWFMGCGSSDHGNEQEAYDGHQALLAMIITVATLLMGFIITGALISLTFTGDETFSADQTVEFVRTAFQAFLCAFLSFTMSFILSILGSQIHAAPNLGFSKASRFFRIFSVVTLVAELCLYLSSCFTFNFLGNYIYMNYASPSHALCAGAGDDGGQVNNLKANKFCPMLGADLYDAATMPNICGLPRKSVRPYNANDSTSLVCNQLDTYFKKSLDESPDFFANNSAGIMTMVNPVAKVWFGYDTVGDLDGVGDDIDVVYNNGKILGEAMCGVGVAQGAMEVMCKDKPGSYECVSMQHAYNDADGCAGEKFDDVVKCYRTCAWLNDWKWGMGGMSVVTIDKEWVTAETAFNPIFDMILWIRRFVVAWMCLRVLIYVMMMFYSNSARACALDGEESQEEDDVESDPLMKPEE